VICHRVALVKRKVKGVEGGLAYFFVITSPKSNLFFDPFHRPGLIFESHVDVFVFHSTSNEESKRSESVAKMIAFDIALNNGQRSCTYLTDTIMIGRLFKVADAIRDEAAAEVFEDGGRTKDPPCSLVETKH
jgi:hypothetical protein